MVIFKLAPSFSTEFLVKKTDLILYLYRYRVFVLISQLVHTVLKYCLVLISLFAPMMVLFHINQTSLDIQGFPPKGHPCLTLLILNLVKQVFHKTLISRKHFEIYRISHFIWELFNLFFSNGAPCI